jgi:hypothetical protein
MRYAECGLRIAELKRTKCRTTPHCLLGAAHLARRGVSLLEVLFAILVCTIGLFGALALLPVASSQARKGRLNDAVGVVAPNCVHEFDARGMRRGTSAWIASNAGGTGYVLASSLPVAQLPATYGTSYCIDPRFVAANDVGPAARRQTARMFPYDATAGEGWMLRCTLDANSGTPTPMNKLLSDSIFTIEDDLAYDRPKDNTIAPTQLFDFLPSLSTVRSRRLSEGHLSWMATVVPKVDRYTVVNVDQFVLSIVVFYDRPTSFGYNEGTSAFDLPDERTVNIGFPGGGITGGEVLLGWTAAQSSANEDLAKELLKLRANDWIMLSGTLTHVTAPAIPVFKWYRVSDLEAEIAYNTTLGQYERYVTLVGPDWDTVNIQTPRAVIVDGVVGVYEKTIRLE